MAQTRRRHPPWEDLPQELLSAIANFLIKNPNPNFLDIHSFRSVCNSWRSSFPPFSPPSILSPILPITTIRPPSSFYSRPWSLGHRFNVSVLSITVVYSLRPKIIQSELAPPIPSSFLLFLDEYESGKLKIRQPLSQQTWYHPATFPAKLNLLDFHAFEIGRFVNLSYCCYYDYVSGDRVSKPRFLSDDVLNVVLFSDGSAAVALFYGGKLGFVRLDSGMNVIGFRRNTKIQWEVIHIGKDIQFDDIVEFKGRVLGLDREGRVYEIDPKLSRIHLVAHSTYTARGSGRRKRLVESLGVLYLVVRRDVGVSFKVYELNVERKRWVGIDSIGDRVFFFGFNFSFSASAEEVSYRNNSFFFRRSSFESYDGYPTDDSKVICPLGDEYADIRVYHLDGATHVGAVQSYSGTSEMFWPPPAWLWPFDRSAFMGPYTKHSQNFKMVESHVSAQTTKPGFGFVEEPTEFL